MGIAARLRLSRLMHIAPDEPDAVGALAEASYAGGADVVMLDEDLADAIADETAEVALASITMAARATQGLTGYFGRPVRAAQLSPDLFVLADAEADPARTRRLVGEWTMIGRRCTSDADTDAALAHPEVDFLMVGPGLERIRYVARKAPAHDPRSKPWFAVGGITHESLGAVLRAGAMRVAVGGAITRAANPEGAAHALKERLRTAWNDDPRMEAVTAAAFGQRPSLNLPSDLKARGGHLSR